MTGALIEMRDVARSFGGAWRLIGGRAPALRALRGVTLEVARRETLGIVGESGCGKSTLARMLVGLDRPTGGAIRLGGAALAGDSRAVARRVQYVFQDPVASLNPRKTIGAALEAPLIRLCGMESAERAARMEDLMRSVGLPSAFLGRFPHELSGGQAQRVAIARALAAEPEAIVLDEPVSALDVSVQAQVLTLLADLKARFGLTYVFISHDLAVVESVADRVAVMYFGRVVELGPARAVMAAPRHPYTRLLLDSAPVPGRGPAVPEDESGELPDPYAPPEGCAFRGRCPRATAICASVDPVLDGPGHAHACHNPLPQRAA